MPYPLSQEHVKDAKLFSSRHEMIKSLAGSGINSIAELGVAYGNFSEFLIETLKPKIFGAYDLFMFDQEDLMLWGESSFTKLKGESHISFFTKRIKEKFKDNVNLLTYIGDSSENLKKYEDTYDLIYIDGNHTLEGVRRDSEASIKKLSPNGILIFNDYIMYDHKNKVDYGIVDVVNYLCVKKDWKIIGFALDREMFCDIMLQKC